MRHSREPKARKFAHVEICRPKAHHPVRGLVLVEQANIFDTHKYEGRTIPCDGPLLCAFCGHLAESQRIYLPLWCLDQKFRFLDLPITQWERIRGFEEQFTTLLGIELIAKREKPKDNAAIALHATDQWRLDHKPIKPFPEFLPHLNHILDGNLEFATERFFSAKTASAE